MAISDTTGPKPGFGAELAEAPTQLLPLGSATASAGILSPKNKVA